MKIGYIRVSTEEQNTIRQEVLMQELGIDEIYIDKASGKNADRPQLKKMLTYIRRGDTVIVESISRFARNTKDLLELIAYSAAGKSTSSSYIYFSRTNNEKSQTVLDKEYTLECSFFCWTNCLWLFDFKSFEQPSEFLPGKVFYITLAARPFKVSILQPLIQKYKSIPFPKECLEPVTASAAEKIETL